MNNVKNDFSIKDLENITGIKAHTIRIWEKRYNLLDPDRTDTNIRHYNLESLQKLLNISFLNNNGIKISKIAELKEDEIAAKVREMASRGRMTHHALNAFKIAMLNFDQVHFYNTYNGLLAEKTFREIFYEIFIPLLNELGMLWQTDTITPAHEHFIAVLIKQKILLNIEKLQNLEPRPPGRTFVLFLPDNEIHDIGLMFINYELRSRGFHTIFLGESVPADSLLDLLDFYEDITFISYFTVKPEAFEIEEYLNEFCNLLLTSPDLAFWILGRKLQTYDTTNLPKGVSAFDSIEALVKNL